MAKGLGLFELAGVGFGGTCNGACNGVCNGACNGVGPQSKF